MALNGRIRLSKQVKLSVALGVCGGVLAWVALTWFNHDLKPPITQTHSSGLRIAPSFDVFDAQGHRAESRQFQGKPMIVHFWASWCAPCLEEFPKWVHLQRAISAAITHSPSKFSEALKKQLQALQWVAISQDSNWADVQRVWPDLSKYRQGRGPESLILLLDPEASVSDAYGTFQFPETYLLGSEQEILYKWVGPQDWEDPKIIEAIVSRL